MKLLTANRLTDGAVVWLTASGDWSASVSAAARLHPEEALAALERAQGEVRRLVGPYLIEVDAAGDVEPRERLRETIRGGGPTVGHSLRAA